MKVLAGAARLRACLIPLAALLSIVVAPQASATLIGDTIGVKLDVHLGSPTATSFFNVSDNPGVLVVDGGGAELTTTVSYPNATTSLTAMLDMTADGFLLTFECFRGSIDQCTSGPDGSAFALSLTDLDWVGAPGRLTGVDISFGDYWDGNGPVTLTEQNRVITDNSYSASFASETILGTDGPNTGTVTGRFRFERDNPAIPEPSVLLLMLLGLGALWLHAGRRQIATG